jgi:hypothetical protein
MAAVVAVVAVVAANVTTAPSADMPAPVHRWIPVTFP